MTSPGKSDEAKFKGIWCRALKLPSLMHLDVDLVSAWAKESMLDVREVVEHPVGRFNPMPAIVLKTAEREACFPKAPDVTDPDWLAQKKHRDDEAELWRKVEWFLPLWVSNGESRALLRDIQHRSNEDAIARFDYHTSTIYTLPFQAVCVAQLIPACRSLVEFAPVVREAYLGCYSGYRASSIAALIPAVEGALRRITKQAPDIPIKDQVDLVFDKACERAAKLYFDGRWVPDAYLTADYLYARDELVFAFETFRQWLKGAFFRNSGEYDGTTWLNRHLFAHGASMQWQEGANFRRLIVALATLGVIESWHDGSDKVSIFFPEMNQDGHLLWQQALYRGQLQMAIKLTEQDQYQAHGRLVPEMPADDGRTLRAAVLQDDCIQDLVRPLREAGWSVQVGEPDDKALWMKVVASSGDSTLTVALLYSCATDNALYRELASECNAILYRGAPYQQDAFTYGIDVHVGPVAGWQPPRAPE